MKMRFAIGALVLCLCSISFVSAQRVERGFIVNAIKIKLSADQPTQAVNAPVVIKFIITNTSQIELPVAGDFTWIVRREDGKPTAETAESLQWKEIRRRSPRSMNVPLGLAPGASSNQEETVSKLYVMDQPGVYLVTMWIGVTDESKTDFIKSNTVRVTIQ